MPKIILSIIFFLVAWYAGRAQHIPLAGEYEYKTPEAKVADILILNEDSSYKWYRPKDTKIKKGKWTYAAEKVILREDSGAKPLEIEVILGEESERAILYYKKRFYFKKVS